MCIRDSFSTASKNARFAAASPDEPSYAAIEADAPWSRGAGAAVAGAVPRPRAVRLRPAAVRTDMGMRMRIDDSFGGGESRVTGECPRPYGGCDDGNR